MALGGKRPGAGRPRKSEKHRGAIAKAEKRIADRLPELVDKQFELAEGVSLIQGSKEVRFVVQLLQGCCKDPEKFEETVDKLKEIFASPPDGNAGRYLIDRIMGKPKQVSELTGKNGDPIETNVRMPQLEELMNLDARELARMYSEALGRSRPAQPDS